MWFIKRTQKMHGRSKQINGGQKKIENSPSIEEYSFFVD
jgi:hypothetical protein